MSAVHRIRPLRAMVSLARRFIGGKDGIAAVEFAFVVPIMLVMFVGTVELSQAITVDRRVSQVASSSADLVARQKTVTTSDLNGYMQIITQLMAPYSATNLKVTIANVYATIAAPTSPKVCWFYHRDNTSAKGANTSLTAGGTYTGLPTGILEGGTSVVVVEVSYNYTPVVLFGAAWSYVDSGLTLSEKFYLKPRLSASIQLDGAAACV